MPPDVKVGDGNGDLDTVETKEWLDALDGVLQTEGPERARFLLSQLKHKAVRNGVDVIAHTTPRSGGWDESILMAMKGRRVAVTPTLTLWKYYTRHDRISIQEQTTNTAVAQLRAWIAAGGEVLFGTDLGAVDYDPGEEYALMRAAGMTFRQILASLTTAPAGRFGESKRLGRIAAGFDADLVVLRGDPAKNIAALTAVE